MIIRGFKGKRGRDQREKDRYRINRDIRAPEVRVIGDDGQMLGVLSVPEALRVAEDQGLDLIEIAPNANPPTCKIMDYGKWKYEAKKKANISRKKQVVINIKEIKLRPRTDEHDLMIKMRNARKFLLNGDKVKVNLRFLGREMAHQEVGLNLLNRVVEILGEVGVSEARPKMEGRQMFTLIAPDPVKIKAYQEKQAKEGAASEKDSAPTEVSPEPEA